MIKITKSFETIKFTESSTEAMIELQFSHEDNTFVIFDKDGDTILDDNYGDINEIEGMIKSIGAAIKYLKQIRNEKEESYK